MIKAIIFDMDGLMIDSEIISYYCYRDLIESYNHPFTLEDYKKEYPGKSLITSLNFIKDKYHLDYDIEEKVNEFHQLETNYIKQDGIKLKDGLIDLLKYLKTNNYKTIIATSSTPKRVEKILTPHNIMKYFDNIVCSNEVERGKPFPDIFLKACDKLGIKPNEALVLEDSEAGIQAAYDAKIPVICIPDMKYPQDKYVHLVEHIYNSLNDIIPYLKQQRKGETTMDIITMIKEECLKSTSKNPIELIMKIMKEDYIVIHGPVHHVLDGACFLTAMHNCRDNFDLANALDEMIVRGQKMPGATCGNWGVCGSAASIGAALSIMHKTGPLSDGQYYKDNLNYVSKSLANIAEIGGPRCCKRNAFVSLLTAIDFVKDNYNIELESQKIICPFSSKNKQCLKTRCPFFGGKND